MSEVSKEFLRQDAIYKLLAEAEAYSNQLQGITPWLDRVAHMDIAEKIDWGVFSEREMDLLLKDEGRDQLAYLRYVLDQ